MWLLPIKDLYETKFSTKNLELHKLFTFSSLWSDRLSGLAYLSYLLYYKIFYSLEQGARSDSDRPYSVGPVVFQQQCITFSDQTICSAQLLHNDGLNTTSISNLRCLINIGVAFTYFKLLMYAESKGMCHDSLVFLYIIIKVQPFSQYIAQNLWSKRAKNWIPKSQ